jgi:hypothetical protein
MSVGHVDLILDEICKMDIPVDDINEIIGILLPHFDSAEKLTPELEKKYLIDYLEHHVMVIAGLGSDMKALKKSKINKSFSEQLAEGIQVSINVLGARLMSLIKKTQETYKDK